MPSKTLPDTKTTPTVVPEVEPEKRYDPEPDHCPGQTVRTVRRIREV